MNRRTIVRRVVPVAAALAVGGGAGAAVYATTTGGTSHTATTTAVAAVPAQPAAARQTTTGLTQLYKDVTPGVVDITVTDSGGSSGFGPFGPGSGRSQAEGSGFVLDTAGHIVTNEHVVDGAASVKVHFKDGKTYSATSLDESVPRTVAE